MPHPIELPAWIDPARVFSAVCGDSAYAFWLDAGPEAREGWSWLGVGAPEPDAARVRAVRVAASGGSADLPGPFGGGWVGWIDYESGAAAAGAPVRPLAPADAAERWLRVDAFLAFDHAAGRAWAIAPDERSARALAARATASVASAVPPAPPATVARARHTSAAYAGLVEDCRARIREGDAYQLCLTTRFSVDGEVDARATYARLRQTAPSHHGGFVRSGAHAIASASPERFVELAGGVVRTHPIKGTRPRGADAASDAALADDLRADPKERAENVMIVDLMRNDLARACEPATVTVERLLEVESYPAVHQLVSTVSGRLRAEATVGDVLDATFPAGSMTGAPKLSAMTILHGLEGAARGAYAGCFGWVGDDGCADLAMLIRTIVVHPGGASVGAGGGITWLSRPDAEVAEVALKARAPLAALGAILPPDW